VARDSGTVFETDLFEHRKVGAHFLNRCCFGEDLALWLKARLLAAPDLALEIGEPLQEDYGWGLWARQGRDRYWIAASYMGEGPQEEPAEWTVSVEGPSGLLRGLFASRAPAAAIRAQIRRSLEAEPAIKLLD
jgi:hypothetical protein